MVRRLLAILSVAWYGAMAIFSGTIFATALFEFVDRFFNNNIIACVVFAFLLIGVTWLAGDTVKKKIG